MMASRECPRCEALMKPRVDLSSSELAELERRLRSDFGPSVVNPERAAELGAILALVDRDIGAHESEMARLQAQVILLQAQKQRLEQQRTKLRSLLSPMRKLPTEVLLHIFEYVCENNLFKCYSRTSSVSPTRLISPIIAYPPTMAISSVCFRWRELALGSPSLWANITVEMHTDPLIQATRFISAVASYLERSGNWPLRLSLDIRGRKLELPSLALFTRHAHRWRIFKYCGEHSLTDYNALSHLCFPSLTEIDIVNDRWIPLTDFNRFEQAPKLRALTSEQVLVDSSLPYRQLDYISFWINSSDDLEEVLQKSPFVKSLRLEFGEFGGLETTYSERPYRWQSVSSLAVGEWSRESCSELIFSCFNFPSLNELRVERLGYTNESCIWPGNAFLPFVSRSACMVTTFTLRGISISHSNLITALHVMPSLLCLDIDDEGNTEGDKEHESPITSHLISSLAHHQPNELFPSSISLVPKLHSLRLFAHSTAFDDHAFVNMVESRWFKPGSDLAAVMLTIGRASLRSIVLTFKRREVDAKVYKALKSLDEEGLRIVVSGTNGVQI
ncbi:hypothetical protein BDP27DRAFT_1314675 [Rhodocollybia butyracea]|uniref:F-box domain-containing protein n=1 Tax=Rhodocollybia butyracea TaxID=206335 RepID=A0A9P5Q0J4_9AGAR|nr:hypothetical protein BDP27DRAFT_1314675 [Rhodocollybia butyracea]